MERTIRILRNAQVYSLCVFCCIHLISCRVINQPDCTASLEKAYLALYQRYDSLQLEQAEPLWPHQRALLLDLRQEEEHIFQLAKNCDFSDRQAYNRWHRSRLKFPSPIAQRLQRP